MPRRILLVLVMTLSGAGLLTARIMSDPWLTYQEMFDKSDLVVIATVQRTKDTAEKSKLLDTVDVIGVETEFNTELILKGSKDVRVFVLHHYREPDEGSTANGPSLLFIGPEKHPPFLLFLTKEKDGRYAPVAGQTDPALISVIKLNSAVKTIAETKG
jgi:hypothetical protein